MNQPIIKLSGPKARKYFLKGSSYFQDDIPEYLSFEPILKSVSDELGSRSYKDIMKGKPGKYPEVNYSLMANKDGRFAWRPYELIHPVIYVSLVNVITEKEHWKTIQKQFKEFGNGAIECCSIPVVSDSDEEQSDKAEQITNWWLNFEQKTLEYSLEFTHLLHTDVTNCYGSLYTHSIPWALHGKKKAKKERKKNLLGNEIDEHIRDSRYGQTNGICQGSVLMDFIAEMVLGYIDLEINEELEKQEKGPENVRVLRYRDDYRIFSNSDNDAEEVLKVISDSLRSVGMMLGVAKTIPYSNVVKGAIKTDKLAGIELSDMDISHAKTIQKQLLRLHSFAREYPNSGALKRLSSKAHRDIVKLCERCEKPEYIDVLVAIVVDIATISPQAFPPLAGILSHLLTFVEGSEREELWGKSLSKLRRIPYNGYLEIWLQRITKPKSVAIPFESEEKICNIADNNKRPRLWKNTWIKDRKVKKALSTSKILIKNPEEIPETISPQEIKLFKKRIEGYYG